MDLHAKNAGLPGNLKLLLMIQNSALAQVNRLTQKRQIAIHQGLECIEFVHSLGIVDSQLSQALKILGHVLNRRVITHQHTFVARKNVAAEGIKT